MKLDKRKVDIALAKKGCTKTELAKNYGMHGVSRSRLSVILNSLEVTPATAGKIAAALDVNVTDIIED